MSSYVLTEARVDFSVYELKVWLNVILKLLPCLPEACSNEKGKQNAQRERKKDKRDIHTSVCKKKKLHPLWFEGRKKKKVYFSLSTNLVSVTTAILNITARAL